MQLKIKLLSGKNFAWNFEPTQSVYKIKEVIGEQENIHPEQINLICQGKILDNNQTVESANLQPNQQIHMVLNLRGGFNVIQEKSN